MNLLIKLMSTIGPSGYEAPVRNLIKKEIKPYVDEITVDSLGNLICHKKGKGEKVMLAAHMDEVGLMVKKIEANGYLRLTPIGGIEPITLVAQSALILDNNNKEVCKGIITFKALHDASNIDELPKMEELYVDTGIGKKELLKKGIQVGSYVVPIQQTRTLGHKNILMGKGLDDRVGCYALIEVARKLKNTKQDLYYVFTVQEEVGLYGGKTATWNIKPDWGIAIETTVASDSEHNGSSIIGSGPFITIKDAEMISNKCLNDWLKKIAKSHKIPLQLEVGEFGTTDARSIMLSRGGIPSTTLSIPVRNIHSTVGVCDTRDIDYLIQLLTIMLKKPPRICDM